ncbi:MAG: serine kinase [Pseudomonadota bacterium]
MPEVPDDDSGKSAIIHYPASCVSSPEGHAVLISGASGSGKSSLCLLLMDRGWSLVSDDQTSLRDDGSSLMAGAAQHLAGLIEIRNLGIVEAPERAGEAPVVLHVSLDPEAPRFIDKAGSVILLGHTVPSIAICPDLAMAAIKTEYALRLYGKRE